MRYFESMPSEFDMTKISDRINYELLDRRIPKVRLARDVGVGRELVSSYTRENFPEESMQIPVLKSFAAYFGKDTYYFCNDYHKFIDTVDVVKLLKRLRKEKAVCHIRFILGCENCTDHLSRKWADQPEIHQSTYSTCCRVYDMRGFHRICIGGVGGKMAWGEKLIGGWKAVAVLRGIGYDESKQD